MTGYRKMMQGAWVLEESIPELKNLDCVIFDCDGTLVNIDRSYNACIKYTAGFMLGRLKGGKQWYKLVTDDIILKFRMSGGFNNDVDTTYASILCALASGTDNVQLARKFVTNIASHADERGVASVEEYLSDVGYKQTVKRTKEELNYPGSVEKSILSRAFDEFFYGPRLFRKMHGQEPQHGSVEAFIDEDEVVISRDALKGTHEMFDGKVAIVSGRSKLATEYSLKSLLRYFDLDASVFIEDEEKKSGKTRNTKRVAKPSPYALLRAMKSLKRRNALCIGDSVEDMLMASKAMESRKGVRTVFCGVFGAVPNSNFQFDLFREKKSDIVMKDVNMLPKLLRSFE